MQYRNCLLGKKVFLRSFFAVLLVLACIHGSLLAGSPAGNPGITSAPEYITLTWTGDPSTTQTITWRTDANTTAGQVQYVEAAGKSSPKAFRTFPGMVESWTTNAGNVNIHSATLTGLKPGTCYIYRVGSNNAWSVTHSFTTSASKAANFKFLIFGDSQSADYDVWSTTLHQAFQANHDAVFFINAGDLVDAGQDYTQWDAWFKAADGVVDTIPVMPVTGNHEYYLPGRGFSPPTYFLTQFKLPQNGPADLRGRVYAFDYGDVHFVMLDSQENEGERFVPNMLDREKAWLEEDLQRTARPWKIAVFHRPPYSNKTGEDNAHVRMSFVPILEKYHVNIVFTGHDHTYARTYPLRGGAIVRNSANGTVYVATGRSGTKTYKDTVGTNLDEFFYDPLDEPIYLSVAVQGDVMSIKVFKQDGGLLDAWAIEKNAKRDALPPAVGR